MREVDRAAQAGVHPWHKHVLIAWALLWTLLVYALPRPLRRLGLVALLLVLLPLLSGPSSPWLPRPAGVSARHHLPGRGRHPGPAGAAVRAAPARLPVAPARAAVVANPRGLLASAPSVSAAAIAQALRADGSPLADARRLPDGRTLAQDLWDRGQAVGIDPAVVMALFWHESHYGTLGMAVLTHSLSNSRPTGPGPVQCSADGCYASERDWGAGIDAMYALLRQYHRWGVTTLAQLIPIWAPASDYNDVAAFTQSTQETLRTLAALSRTEECGAGCAARREQRNRRCGSARDGTGGALEGGMGPQRTADTPRSTAHPRD